MSEVRVILIGGRWAGKSSSGNTILRQERFECGRTRTAQSEVRHEIVEGRQLVVVDAPGWSRSLSLTEIPESNKLRFKFNASKCPPGPQAFLLAIPIDSAFSVEQKKTVEEHMKLLGERVWKYTMVLFTCGDFLGGKTIEQHIESEGEPLKWLIQRCKNRYHVFNNKDKSDVSQITQLLEKIDEMVRHNKGSYYEVDEQILTIIKEKQEEVAGRAADRRRRAEDQRQQMKTLIPEEINLLPKLQMVLMGSRNVGKTSVGNTILEIKEQIVGKRTTHSVVRQGFVGKTEISLVDTPGWWTGFHVVDSPEVIKEELMLSMFLCPPGPHVFLLVIDSDASFNAKHLDAVTSHMELLGEEVWKHTMVVFTRGDWLGTNTIEEYIEGEGEALQSLVDRCGNRYHVLDNKNTDDGTEVTELLEKITETVAGNDWTHFVPDEQILTTIEERRRSVEKRVKLRESQVKARRNSLKGTRKKLKELNIVMLSQKASGKTAAGNTILHKQVFPKADNECSHMEEGEVSGRHITVIDTPGWKRDSSRWTIETDKEIVRGFSLKPSGVHAILLVIPLDLTFRESEQIAVEEHMSLFDASAWKHTMVLFTYGDRLGVESVEEHIEREHRALRWLVDRCENKYHVVNNLKISDMSQVTELFEKIEEMVAENGGLYCPDMHDTHLRIEEKHRRGQVKHVLKQRMEQEYRRRELELMMGFKEKLLGLQAEIRGQSVGTTKHKSLPLVSDMSKAIKARGIGQKKDEKVKEKNVEAKISQEIEQLDKDILRSKSLLRGSIDFLIPDLKGDGSTLSLTESSDNRNMSTSPFDKVLGWLSSLQIKTNGENQLTLNFSQTSGYRSVLPQDDVF